MEWLAGAVGCVAGFVLCYAWMCMVIEHRSIQREDNHNAETAQERAQQRQDQRTEDRVRWQAIADEVRDTGKCEVRHVREQLDALEYPLTSQQWREMEFTFYAFRERLQGKPKLYLDRDEDAKPPSAKFMAKLEARLQPKESNTG